MFVACKQKLQSQVLFSLEQTRPQGHLIAAPNTPHREEMEEMELGSSQQCTAQQDTTDIN